MAAFFYDNQVRRFLIQFGKIFSNWYVTKGKDPAGNDILVRVPIQYGDQSRQVSTVIANNSPSSLPIISVNRSTGNQLADDPLSDVL